VDKLNGIVKFFKKDSMWGFITHNNKDYFVHGNNIMEKEKILYYGENVTFTVIETTKGVMAVDVQRSRPNTGVCTSESAKETQV
jgi:cold shock CspA family protein